MKKYLLLLVAITGIMGMKDADAQTWVNYDSTNSPLPQLIPPLGGAYNGARIESDKFGNIWVKAGNSSGLSGELFKFDGTTWTVYNSGNSPLPSQINDFAVDTNGVVWISGHSVSINSAVIMSFDGNDATAVFSVADIIGVTPSSNVVFDVYVDKYNNKKWFYTRYGEAILGSIRSYDDATWTSFPPSENPNYPTGKIVGGVATDDNNITWTVSYPSVGVGGGSYLPKLHRFTGTNWFNYTSFNTNGMLPSDINRDFALDKNGNKWMVGNAGVIVLSGLYSWSSYNTGTSPLPYSSVSTVYIDSDNNKWFGSDYSDDDGPTMFDGTNWVIYNTENSGIAGNSIYDITQDANGNMWFATDSGLSVLMNTTLPIHLIAITGRQQEGNNIIEWTTTGEEATGSFEIERSADATDFKTIGRVSAQQGSAERLSYAFTDTDPLPKNYYRLKMTDETGAISYSKIVFLQQSAGTRPVLYPNPVKDQLHIANIKDNTEIYIADINGKTALRTTASARHAIDISSLPPGVYSCHIGNEVMSFVKQ